MSHIGSHITHICNRELYPYFQGVHSKDIFLTNLHTLYRKDQEFVSDINYFYQLPSYPSNTLIFQFFWFIKVEGMNLLFLPPINSWFSLNKEVDKTREAGVEGGGENELYAGVGAMTAELILGWQSKPNIWNQNLWISSWRMSCIHIIN